MTLVWLGTLLTPSTVIFHRYCEIRQIRLPVSILRYSKHGSVWRYHDDSDMRNRKTPNTGGENVFGPIKGMTLLCMILRPFRAVRGVSGDG